jgi:hypothetical protein
MPAEARPLPTAERQALLHHLWCNGQALAGLATLCNGHADLHLVPGEQLGCLLSLLAGDLASLAAALE